MAARTRVRFAPSPTGLLHLGNARAALFNWLYARRLGGDFILRLEDTDMDRSSMEAERGIYVSLKWLGLEWDEGPVSYERFRDPGSGGSGPYRQSERLDFYDEYLGRLRDAGRAYRCFCPPERIEEERRAANREGGVYRYSGSCSELGAEEADLRAEAGEPFVWRFRTEGADVCWTDLVRGDIHWGGDQIGDFVLVRSTGRPTYNFAVVADDQLMEITHVIRGDDHIANTPRQLLLHEALGLAPPEFAHLPLITGPDHKPLAKRHGAENLDDLFREGYLPAAVANYLALLGWSPPDGREIMSLGEMAELFDLARVGKSPSVFDKKKLAWINGKHMRGMDAGAIADALRPYLEHHGYRPAELDRAWLCRAVECARERIGLCVDAVEELRPFLDERPDFEDDAVAAISGEGARLLLERLVEELAGQEEIGAGSALAAIKAAGKARGRSGKDLYLPVRAAISGRTHGPGLPEMMAVLGKERLVARLEKAVIMSRECGCAI